MKFSILKLLVTKLCLLTLALAELEFKTGPSTRLGANFPFPKGKTGFFGADSKGEDSFSLVPKALTVSDGTSGSKYATYFLSENLAIASADFNLRRSEELVKIDAEKIELGLGELATEAESDELRSKTNDLQKGIEEAIDSFMFAFQCSLFDFLTQSFKITRAKQRLPKLESFNAYVKEYSSAAKEKKIELKKGFNKIMEDYSEYIINGKTYDKTERLSKMSSTFAAAMLINKEGKDWLEIYKYGDSLITAFQLKTTGEEGNQKSFFEPFYLTNNFKVSFKFSHQLKSQFLISEGEYEKLEERLKNEDNDFKKKVSAGQIDGKNYKIFKLEAQPFDIVLGASDGVYDNLPLSAITFLLNQAVAYFVKNDERLKALEDELLASRAFDTTQVKEELDKTVQEGLMAQLEQTITQYVEFATDPDVFSQANYDQLKELINLGVHRPMPGKVENEKEALFERQEEPNPFKRCPVYQIFFTRWVERPEEARRSESGLLSQCMLRVLEREVSFARGNVEAILKERFDVNRVSGFIAGAVKLLTLVYNYSLPIVSNKTLRSKLAESTAKRSELENQKLLISGELKLLLEKQKIILSSAEILSEAVERTKPEISSTNEKKLQDDLLKIEAKNTESLASNFQTETQIKDNIGAKNLGLIELDSLIQANKERVSTIDEEIQKELRVLEEEISEEHKRQWLSTSKLVPEKIDLIDSLNQLIKVALNITKNLKIGSFDVQKISQQSLKEGIWPKFEFLNCSDLSQCISLKAKKFLAGFSAKEDDFTVVASILLESERSADLLEMREELEKRKETWWELYKTTTLKWLTVTNRVNRQQI